MCELIYRSALLNLYANTDDCNIDHCAVPIPVIRQNILDQPTIEAEPVRHGYWILKDSGEGLRRVCSRCGNESKQETPFCAHCGARMDGGTKNENA